MNTKSIISVALATALLGAASCNSEDDKELLGSVAESNTPHLITFNASAEAVGNSLLKASYSGDCVFTWTEGDEVNMFNSTDASNTISLKCDGGFVSGNTYYACLLPVSGDPEISVTLYGADGKAISYASPVLSAVNRNDRIEAQPPTSALHKEVTVTLADLDWWNNVPNTAAKVVFDSKSKVNVSSMERKALVANGQIGIYANGSEYYVLSENDFEICMSGSLVKGTSTGMFRDYKSLEKIEFNNFNTTAVTDMQYMFYNCSQLTGLDLSNFNTVKVENMDCMFYNCSQLEELDLSNFNTVKVEKMSSMFSGCSQLTELDLSSFNTELIRYMDYMFYNCSQLAKLDLSNFNTVKVENMDRMFAYCSKLTELDLSSFNTELIRYMDHMFYNCSQLAELDLSNFNTVKVEKMSSMFSGCSQLTELDLRNFNTEKVKSMISMFEGCSTLKTIEVSDKFTTNAVTQSTGMFSGCTALEGGMGTKVTVTDKTYAKIDKPGQEGYFTDADNVYLTLEDINWTNNVPNTATKVVFDYKKNQSANISGITPTLCKNGDIAIYNSGTEYYILSDKNICMVGSLEGMFKDYGSLTSIEFANFNTEYVDNMSYMFNNCSALTVIYATDNFTTGSVKSSSAMFRDCSSLKGGNGYKPAVWTLMSAGKTYAIIDGKDGKNGLFTDIAAKK